MYMKYFARFYIYAKAVSNGTCYRKDFRAKSTVYDYFKLWKEKPCSNKPSLLEQGFKKMWLGRSVSAMDARFAGCHCGDHSRGNG
jgi:hypothetical protein